MGKAIPFKTPMTKKLEDVPYHVMTPMELHEMRNGSNGDLFFPVIGYPHTSTILDYEVGFFGILVPDGIFPLVRIIVRPAPRDLYSTDSHIYVCNGKRLSV